MALISNVVQICWVNLPSQHRTAKLNYMRGYNEYLDHTSQLLQSCNDSFTLYASMWPIDYPNEHSTYLYNLFCQELFICTTSMLMRNPSLSVSQSSQ